MPSLACAADAITAARPGARTETTEIYLKRLRDRGASPTASTACARATPSRPAARSASSSTPSRVDDSAAMQMARDISKQIEEKLKYPGQIKVTVIRETRCVEYAR